MLKRVCASTLEPDRVEMAGKTSEKIFHFPRTERRLTRTIPVSSYANKINELQTQRVASNFPASRGVPIAGS